METTPSLGQYLEDILNFSLGNLPQKRVKVGENTLLILDIDKYNLLKSDFEKAEDYYNEDQSKKYTMKAGRVELIRSFSKLKKKPYADKKTKQ